MNNQDMVEEMNMKLEEIECIFENVIHNYISQDNASDEIKASFESWCYNFKERL